MRKNQEYNLAKSISTYLKLQYPSIIFRFDMAGLNLSKAQAGMNKAIQYGKGYPDLQILATSQKGNVYYKGMFLELKCEGTATRKKDGSYVSEHVKNQAEMLRRLMDAGYFASFSIGFDMTKKMIDQYLNP